MPVFRIMYCGGSAIENVTANYYIVDQDHNSVTFYDRLIPQVSSRTIAYYSGVNSIVEVPADA